MPGVTGRAGGGSDPAVLAAAATGIVGYIEELGGDVDRIFGSAGIAPEMTGSPTLKLRLGAFCNLFEQAARLTHHGNFGLWFGNRFPPRALGLWGYAAVSAPTLGSALETMVELFRFHQTSSMLRLARDDGDLLRLEYQIEAPAIVERRQDAELSLGMFLNIFRESAGARWTPVRVHFEHPRPEGWHEHETAFGAPVYFSQPTNALVFRDDLVDRPMPAHDGALLTIMRTCLQHLGRQGGDPSSLVDQIRNVIRTRLPGGYPSLDQIAEALRLTPSAVKRELGREGVSYSALVEATRRELAGMYLRQEHLPFSEIALLLGYSELSAFSRAVRRWTGASPRTVRARLRRA